MQKLDARILSLFQEQEQQDLSTTSIVHLLFPEANLQKLPYASKQELAQLKRKKAQLQRKVLYHLNKFVDEGILKISREGAKGKKYFSLNLNPGEELRYKKHIIITKNTFPNTTIEGYEQKSIIHLFDPELLTTRLNSVLVFCNAFSSLKSVQQECEQLLIEVNDSLALHNFETLLLQDDLTFATDFVETIDLACVRMNKSVCIILNSEEFHSEQTKNIEQFIEIFAKIRPKKLRIVFSLTHKTLNKHANFFERVFELFSSSRLTCYFKNHVLHSPPYFIGRAGPYTLTESEWEEFKSKNNQALKTLAIGHASALIDLQKFFEYETRTYKIQEVVLSCLRTLFSINRLQRKHAREYFKQLTNHSPPKNVFSISKNYLRLWNYENAGLSSQEVLVLLEDIWKQVKQFRDNQNIIYQSCGMPFHFAVSLASACTHFKNPKLTDLPVRDMVMKRIEDFYSKENIAILEKKEKYFDQLKGGDRLKIHHSANAKGSDIVREVNFMLITYRIPFFCFDFTHSKSMHMNLQTYLNNGNT